MSVCRGVCCVCADLPISNLQEEDPDADPKVSAVGKHKCTISDRLTHLQVEKATAQIKSLARQRDAQTLHQQHAYHIAPPAACTPHQAVAGIQRMPRMHEQLGQRHANSTSTIVGTAYVFAVVCCVIAHQVADGIARMNNLSSGTPFPHLAITNLIVV